MPSQPRKLFQGKKNKKTKTKKRQKEARTSWTDLKHLAVLVGQFLPRAAESRDGAMPQATHDGEHGVVVLVFLTALWAQAGNIHVITLLSTTAYLCKLHHHLSTQNVH